MNFDGRLLALELRIQIHEDKIDNLQQQIHDLKEMIEVIKLYTLS